MSGISKENVAFYLLWRKVVTKQGHCRSAETVARSWRFYTPFLAEAESFSAKKGMWKRRYCG